MSNKRSRAAGMLWRKKDWRKEKVFGHNRHHPHLVVRWFQWSWRPRIYIHYWEPSMHEMRYKTLDLKECTYVEQTSPSK